MYSFQDFLNVKDDPTQCILIEQGGMQDNINPSCITNILEFGEENDMDKFWQHHGNTKDSYIELAKNYYDSLEEIKKNGDLNHLAWNDPLKRANEAYNTKLDPVNLIEYDGSYFFDGDGRHRILAAQELQKMGYEINIPARVTKFINPSKTVDVDFINSQTIANNNTVFNVSNDLEVQLQKLIELKQFLLNFSQLLESNIFSYRTKFDALKQTGLSKEFIQKYELGNILPERQIIERMKQKILDKNLAYIYNNIQAIETAIWIAKKTK